MRALPMTLALVVTAPLSGILDTMFGPRPPIVIGLAAMAAALFSLRFLHADSSYSTLWPAFVIFGAGVGLVLTAGSHAVVGNARVEDSGLAAGMQSTARQLGSVLAISVLGSLLSSRAASVLAGDLISAGTPAPIAHELGSADAVLERVAQGVSPTLPGAPAQLAEALTHGSESAFMSGMHTAMLAMAAVVALAALLAVLMRPVSNSAQQLPSTSDRTQGT